MMNFNSLALAAVYRLGRAWVGSGVFDRLENLIFVFIGSDIPGEEKKQAVIDFAVKELDIAKNGLLTTKWKIIIDFVIAITRLRYELPNG
jgi:hypothetical protein